MFSLPYHVAAGTFKRPVPRYQFLQATADNTNNGTYTFTNQALGLPSANRLIVVGVHSEDALTTYTFNSGTINGVTATVLITGAPANTVVSGLMYANVPAGDSGSIAVTFSEAVTSCAIGVYALYNYRPTNESLFTASEATGTGVMNVEQDASRRPYALTIGASSNVGGETCTWTSVTAGRDGFVREHYDADSGELGYSGASIYNPHGTFSIPGLSASWSGAGEGDLVGVTFLASYDVPGKTFLP